MYIVSVHITFQTRRENHCNNDHLKISKQSEMMIMMMGLPYRDHFPLPTFITYICKGYRNYKINPAADFVQRWNICTVFHITFRFEKATPLPTPPYNDLILG